MLAAIFSFRGRLNRIQYFLGGCGLALALVALAVILFVGALSGRSSGRPDIASLGLTALFCLVVLVPLYAWISFSLQARRFRDIGWEPAFVIPAWIGLDVLDRILVMAAPQFAVSAGAGVSLLGLLLNLGLGLCLLFWPGRPGYDIGSVAAVFDDAPPPPSEPPRSAPEPRPATGWGAAMSTARPTGPTPAGFGRRGL
jgi:uncharacterized membrane protein YhaH (DUF805 family)